MTQDDGNYYAKNVHVTIWIYTHQLNDIKKLVERRCYDSVSAFARKAIETYLYDHHFTDE